MNQPAVQTIEPRPYFFSARALARLAVYRAAVIARFYSDHCDDHFEPISIQAAEAPTEVFSEVFS